MCDLGGEKDRFWLRREELSHRQMRRAQDQTENTHSHNIRCKIALSCEDQNRTGFQDSGFKSPGDKECSGLSFRSEGISSVNGFYSDNSSPDLQVLSLCHVVISTSILSSKLLQSCCCPGPCVHVGTSNLL